MVSVPDPADVVTTPLAGPAAWAGVVAVICVAESTVKLVTGCPPMVTAVAPVRSVPVITTPVPPAIGPDAGEILLIEGAMGELAPHVTVACTSLQDWKMSSKHTPHNRSRPEVL